LPNHRKGQKWRLAGARRVAAIGAILLVTLNVCVAVRRARRLVRCSAMRRDIEPTTVTGAEADCHAHGNKFVNNFLAIYQRIAAPRNVLFGILAA